MVCGYWEQKHRKCEIFFWCQAFASFSDTLNGGDLRLQPKIISPLGIWQPHACIWIPIQQ